MSIPLRVCLFDAGATKDASFRPPFELVEGLHVIDLCPNWAMLQEHLRLANIDAVAVNLDHSEGESRFLIIQRIAEVAPECAVIGVSSDTNPDTIIAAMRAGCAQFVRAPIDIADLRTALDRIRQTRLPAAAGCLHVGLIGSAGGAGATTLASNLALELAHAAEQRVALVDMNLQFGDVACMFDLSPKHTLSDVCAAGVQIDRTLLDMALEALPCQVSVLAAPLTLEHSEQVDPDAVEQLFRHLAQMFPFTVIDLPRHFSAASLSALRAADRIFIVSQLAVPCLRNASRIHEALVTVGIDDSRVELVLNRCNANHERVKPIDVEKHFGRPVFASIPNDYKRITASRDLGHPILTEAPNSPARLAIQQLAQTLVRQHLGGDAANQGKAGFLGGLFRKKRNGTNAPAQANSTSSG